MRGLWHNKNPILAGKLTRPSLAEGAGVFTDHAGTATDLFLRHGVPFLAKNGLEAGRYYASEALRNPALQKQMLDYGMKKAAPVVGKVGHELLDQLSTKVRPNRWYKTNRKDLDGSGLPVPFPFVDFKKLWDVVSNPNLYRGPEISEEERRAMVAEYKRQYRDYKSQGGTRSYGLWIKWKGLGKRFTGAGLFVLAVTLSRISAQNC